MVSRENALSVATRGSNGSAEVMEDDETILPGGNANRGMVVRRGDCVHRPRGKTSAVVAAVLWHLEKVGFEGAPSYRGTDGEGRDVLSWVDGEAVTGTPPKWVSSSGTLNKASSLLRALHVALRSFVYDRPWTPLWPPPRMSRWP